MSLLARLFGSKAKPFHKYAIGDKVVFTNIFGVCWGVKTITALDERNGPTYHYEPTDTPWFSVAEENLSPATQEDLKAEGDWDYFQRRYGFTPTDYFGCW